MRQLIGLSLSGCVRAILDGDVKIEEVLSIITGTRAFTESEWDEVIERYRANYWTAVSWDQETGDMTKVDRTQRARKIIQELRSSNRITQPRVNGQEPSNISRGQWLLFDENTGEWRQCNNIGKF